MSGATLREYLFGKLRTRMWARYDSAMRVLYEWGEKFERDEQDGANVAFRARYHKVIDPIRKVLNEPEAEHGRSDDRVDRAGAIARLAGDADRGPGLNLLPDPYGRMTHVNDNVGSWTMYQAYHFPDDKGDVVVCIPEGLNDGEKMKAWTCVARMAASPTHQVQTDESLEDFTGEAIGSFTVSHPDYPDDSAVQLFRGINELVAAALEQEERTARLDAALKPFQEKT